MMKSRRSLTLVKGKQRFVFRYEVGGEPTLLATFVELANDPESEFDWLDAAVLSFRMGQQQESQLDPVSG
jgi:hypothetical protein